MVDDPNRKSLRQFQCRDYLWDSFEQLSRELECSVDYLVNEAMRQYLRAQGRGATKSVPTDARASGAMPARPSSPGRDMASPMAGMQRPQSMPPAMPARPAMPALPGAPSRVPAMPPAGGHAPARPAPPPGMPARPGGVPPLPGGGAQRPGVPSLPHQQAQMPAPAPAPMQRAPAPAPAPSANRVLYAVYQDQTVPVNKEEFFIGRGQKSCDLVIKDTNVSRQHARVVLHNGQFWLLDNQSTNGVEFRGAKITQKRIDDGDVYVICGHDISFHYR